ncbi:ABC transporter permease subunit [candidate division KSB3 bacterium]|uniref:ABC transporter permease subunit n=1 Tax=candidate division KSB3 bacterium TaxID=2044937 RepID=A0A9D5Q600_9BACT|nr:ABC transporter permease subunit [candidate division KSB3 bacterium]MBD3324391.1 ABC transporter permease subunit [candidate division KSB3 bacterium]
MASQPRREEFQIGSKHHRLFPNLLIIPALLPLVLFILLPALQTIYMSFHRMTFGLPNEYVGLLNFIDMFKDRLFKRAFLNTLLFSFSVVTGQISLGLATAVLMSTGFKFQKFYISIIMIPYAVSEVVAIIIWKYMLEPEVGIINFLLDGVFGLGQVEWASNATQAWIVIILLRIWLTFPFSFLILYSALIGVPKELYESAFIDGASNWQGFRLISVPLITPAIMVATIFGFVFEFRNFATVWILTEGGPLHKTELLSTLLYRQAFTFWEFGAASAIAMTMTVLTFCIALYYLRSMYQEMFVKQKA